MPRPPNPAVRARLLKAGQDLIHTNGFNGCGIQDITAKAGIPKGSFYNYFDSKEALITAILDEYWQVIDDHHVPILLNVRMKPLTRIRKFFEGLAHDHQERGFSKGCLIGNIALELCDSSKAVRAKIAGLVETWELIMADCLREAQEDGELSLSSDPRELAALLIESYEGAVMRGKIENSGKPCDRFVRRVLPRILGN